MPREFTRSVRVAAQLQRELAELLRGQVCDAKLGMVTVSDVEVTRDLSLAKVFVSFLGATESVPRSLASLAEGAPALRRELARRIRMRNIPELRFVYDDSIERGMRMDALLSELKGPTTTDADGKKTPPEQE
jgi:ribosome-binding factor A